MKTIYKPWGKEEWLELNNSYCYKRIYINSGYKTSYQYHNFKRETNYIISGEAEIWLENDDGIVEKKIMKAGEFFNVTPPKKHRVIALTDIILQEVSTPEVDDVIRIQDDAGRKDGKIEGEHMVPAVLILSAGLGTRLQKLTKYVNKALIPLGEKAVISHIIEKFPKDYELVMAVGYKSDSLKEYCDIAHSDRKITYVDIPQFEDEGSGPGLSALCCKFLLQRPFYMVTADCLISEKMPPIDGNWLGVYPTSYPEKYSTIKVNNEGNVSEFTNKNPNGFDLAFIGLCGILDYETFWKELETNIEKGEVVSAWKVPSNYSQLKTKELDWFDLGNLDDFSKTQTILGIKPLSLSKDVGEFTYRVGNKFLKFNESESVTTNRYLRSQKLSDLIPPNYKKKKYFFYYDWVEGDTLYNINNLELFLKFLNCYMNKIYYVVSNNELVNLSNDEIEGFYRKKTMGRINQFIERYGCKYYKDTLIINGTLCESLENLVNKSINKLLSNNTQLNVRDGYFSFHGDLQFDNILYNNKSDTFYYLDWRESFNGNVEGGSILYDLGKLYGGSLISYALMKNQNNILFSESFPNLDYRLSSTESLKDFSVILEGCLSNDLSIVKIMTALIYINMAALHDESFGKSLWCKGIEMLNENQ